MSDVKPGGFGDWGPGGEHGSVPATTPQTEAPSPEQVLTEMKTADGPSAETQALVQTGPSAQSAPTDPTDKWEFDSKGNPIPETNEHGLPPEIAKEMHASADGFDAELASLQSSATRVLEPMPDPQSFVQHFETLSEPIKVKALQALRNNPHLDIYGLVDLVQPKLTLEEMAEAQAWIKGLKK
jgi:hypothetical protein